MFLSFWVNEKQTLYICMYVYIQSSEYFSYYTLLKLLNEADILFVIDFLWISIILHIITDLVFFSTVVICWPPLAIIKYAYSWNWFLPSLVSQWSAPDSVLFHFYFFDIFPNVYSHFDVMATTMVVYCTYISFELLPRAIRPTSHKNSS